MENFIDLPTFNGLIIDDHQLFAQGLVELLKTMTDSSSIIQSIAAEKAALELTNNKYEFLFIDLLMPGIDTIGFITACRKKYPALIIVVISSILEINKVKQCFSVGANGYISKAVNAYELKMALERTYNGDKYVSSDLNGKLANSLFTIEQNNLTAKELEILRLIADGYKVDKIAGTLFLSPFTV